MFAWLENMIGLSVEIPSSLPLTEAAVKRVLYVQTSLAAGGETQTPKVLVEHKEKLAGSQVFALWYLGQMDTPTGD